MAIRYVNHRTQKLFCVEKCNLDEGAVGCDIRNCQLPSSNIHPDMNITYPQLSIPDVQPNTMH